MPRIHVLGTGTPTPTPDRFGTAFVVDVDGELIMFDCGPSATHKLVKAGLWPTEIDNLFSTQALSQSRSGPTVEQPAPIERGAATPWLTISEAAEYLSASEDMSGTSHY